MTTITLTIFIQAFLLILLIFTPYWIGKLWLSKKDNNNNNNNHPNIVYWFRGMILILVFTVVLSLIGSIIYYSYELIYNNLDKLQL